MSVRTMLVQTCCLVIMMAAATTSQFSRKVIFEVNNEALQLESNLSDKIQLSDLLYYSTEYNFSNIPLDPHTGTRQYNPYALLSWTSRTMNDAYYIVNGLSVILQNDGLFSLKKYGNLANFLYDKRKIYQLIHHGRLGLVAVIFQVDGMLFADRKQCDCGDFNRGLALMLENTLDHSPANKRNKTTSPALPQIGIEYDELLVDCCSASIFKVLEKVDIAVFEVKLTLSKFLFSASFFADWIGPLLGRNENFVRKANSNCKIVIRLKVVTETSDDTDEKTRFLYLAHIKKYVDAWLQQGSSASDAVTLETYPASVQITEYKLGNAVMPVLLESKPLYHHYEDLKSPCQLHYLLNLTLSSFQIILLKLHTANPLGSLQGHCTSNHLHFPQFSHNTKNGSIGVMARGEYLDNFQEMFHEITNKSGAYQNMISSVVFTNPPGADKILLNSSIIATLASGVIKVGCVLPLDHINSSREFCGEHLLNQSSIIIVERVVDEWQLDTLPRELMDLQASRINLFKQYPDKQILINLVITNYNSNRYLSATVVRRTARMTIYCDHAVQKLYETYDAVLTFAQIHNFGKIILQNAMYRENVGGWWSSIETLKSANRLATDFPLLVQRNVPAGILDRMKLTNNFKCLNWTEEPIESGINFLRNTHFGAKINLTGIKLRSTKHLAQDEMRTAFLFVFSKFSFVEIIAAQESDVEELRRAVGKQVHNAVLRSGAAENGNTTLYMVQVPVTLLVKNPHLLFKFISSSGVGIHLSGWEDISLANLSLLTNTISAFFPDFNSPQNGMPLLGITIKNCFVEINSKFTKIRTNPVLKYASYVVCSDVYVKAENHDQDYMQMFLDTQFYLSQYFKSFRELGNLDIYFSLTFLNGKCRDSRNKVSSFLRVLNDLNQHSETYGVKYIVNGFENEDKTGNYSACPGAWWTIRDNATDLTIRSSFLEKESDYFKRETTIKLKENATKWDNDGGSQVVSSIQPILIIVGVCILVLLLLILFIVLGRRLAGDKNKYLTKDELDIFRNGRALVGKHGNIMMGDLLEDGKFAENLEILKENMQFCEILGRGKFGIVHRALLNDDEIQVAVKRPQPHCLKESFKSMLIEVKIHSFIGSHPFVLKFIGACTKEIDAGKLYIVTEFCGNGNLKSYLDAKNAQLKMKESVGLDMYQLCLFSCQIASGMGFIAEKRVIHGDLSARNVLLDSEFNCKICDFGLSRRLYENKEYVKKSKEPMPWRWMAIESLKNREFTTRSDVWSYGVTGWEIFSLGGLPYPSKEFTDDFIADLENGFRLPNAAYATPNIHEKLMDCWKASAEERPDFDNLTGYFADLRSSEYATL